jgi:membrane fusion protein, multidrug efflux system
MTSRFFTSTTIVFAAIILLVAFWIASGMIGREEEEVAAPQRPLPIVTASWSEALPVDQRLSLYGDVEPTQVATVRARTDGLIESVAEQGTVVVQGDELAQLSTDDREARLARGEAQVANAERSYDAAVQLAERNVGPQSDVQARLAELEAARAELRAIQLDIENTTLTAPIPGIVNRVIAEIGAYVSAGGEVLEIVDNDPLIAVVQVQQSQIVNVRRGMPAMVSFIGGRQAEGRVSFVSPLADAATRTFRVEVEVPNPDGEVPAGISVEVMLVTATVDAHHLSSALLRLDEQGQLGLYAVENDDSVVFKPVEIVMADSSGIWVTGLLARDRLVTISQGAVAAGETVTVEETPAEYQARVIRPRQSDDVSPAGDHEQPEAR